jgi:ABC-2 type transport system ATP-binding protein
LNTIVAGESDNPSSRQYAVLVACNNIVVYIVAAYRTESETAADFFTLYNVLENPPFIDRLIGEEYMHFVGRMYGLEEQDVRKRTGELSALLELNERRRKQIRAYSAGMKNRVSLSAALVHDPELLILDEPFEGIDAVSSTAIREIPARMVEIGRTVFLTSHMLEIVERLCDEVAIIHKGRLVFATTSSDIRSTFKDKEKSERYAGLEDLFLSIVGKKDRGTLSWLE